MTQEQIYARLTDLFRDFFSDDGIALTSETTAADIEGWDSFNHISVMVAIETRFGIKLSTADLDKLANIGQLVAAIERKHPA